VAIDNPALTVVGSIPPGAAGFCSPSGLAFDRAGSLYVTETDRIYKFKPSASAPPLGTLFASGVPGTNGLAFDEDGNLWTGDGTTGQGRVWKIDRDGNVALMFRIPPGQFGGRRPQCDHAAARNRATARGERRCLR
jgi:DNA-binding beta-propeller fold protein YncE